jgi:hypothetical protein
MTKSIAIQETTTWLTEIVIGLNLCPFAHKVYTQKKLSLEEMAYTDQALLDNTNKIIEDLLNPATTTTTTLLIISEGLEDFNLYLDTLYALEEALKGQGLHEEIQLASFHPLYTFEGIDSEALQNYTNRSPYPIIHFLKVEEMAEAIKAHPNTDHIPTENIKKLNKLGLEALLRLYHNPKPT